MALIDDAREEIVIRILYDGPPLAGKTSTLKRLASMLAERRRGSLFTPDEAEGRTLSFDWMDYLGGCVEGQQVRCQLVTVPGQRSLYARRKLLLEDADVVVFVAESTAEGMRAARENFAQLAEILGERELEGPPIPIVVQANKQDVADALTVDQVRSALPAARHVALLGSSVLTGAGVREAFTFAVRIALDRVRELHKKGELEIGAPRVRTGEDLLEWLEGREARETVGAREDVGSRQGEATETDAIAAIRQTYAPAHANAEPAPADPDLGEDSTADRSSAALSSSVLSGSEPATAESADAARIGTERVGSELAEPAPIRPPVRPADASSAPAGASPTGRATGASLRGELALPSSRTPTGLVWPPVGGRILLLDLERTFRGSLESHPSGGVGVMVPGAWMLRCRDEDVYSDLEEGRRALLRLAREHTSLGAILSDQRALTLSRSEAGPWCLWHVVDLRGSLGRELRAVESADSPELVASVIWRVALTLVSAAEAFPAVSPRLPVSIETIERVETTARYLGVVPKVGEATASLPGSDVTGCELLDRELGPVLAGGMGEMACDIRHVISCLKRLRVAGRHQEVLRDRVVGLIIGD